MAGESGCGKSTTANLLLNLIEPTSGEIYYNDKNIVDLKKQELKSFRKEAQLIFQDPYESLNPRFSVKRAIEEPVLINFKLDKKERLDLIKKAMKRSRLLPVEGYLDKFPHELSGGERQRVCIARAIVLEPKLLVADEAVSMLDVSIRASILNIIRELTGELEMATLYISHDLSLLGSICDYIAIMYGGCIVEYGKPESVIKNPMHPYTKSLIDAVPIPDFKMGKKSFENIVPGEPPDMVNYNGTCSFEPRCNVRKKVCKKNKNRKKSISQTITLPFV